MVNFRERCRKELSRVVDHVNAHQARKHEIAVKKAVTKFAESVEIFASHDPTDPERKQRIIASYEQDLKHKGNHYR